MIERIGFIGVGMMGQGMARNLLNKGFAVTVVAHRNRAPVDSLTAEGAGEVASPAELAQGVDVVILCVTGSPQVEQIVYGDRGLLSGARDGLIVIDCSTSEPSSTLRIAEDFAARNIRMADAPLARTPVEAAQGRLNAMVGADDALFAEIKPILDTFCENIFHVGPLGAGHKTKLINNFIAMGYAALVAEAFTACIATDVDPRKLYEVVSVGGANSGILQMIMPKAIDGDYAGLRFGLSNARKDLQYYRRMAEAAGLAGTLGDDVHRIFVQAANLGYGDRFVGSLIEAQARLNALKPPAGSDP